MKLTELIPIDNTVQIGDKVFCSLRGNGIITEIKQDHRVFPIIAIFGNIEESYTLHGGIYEDKTYRITLFKGHFNKLFGEPIN